MKHIQNEDYDRFLLQIKRKLKERFEKSSDYTEEKDLGLEFIIQVPKEFILADKKVANDIFWSEKRPSVILLTQNGSVGITFQQVKEDEEQTVGNPKQYRENVRQVLERIDDRVVFYEQGEIGEEKKVFWIEYKSFCSNEKLYNILFLFQVGKKSVLGTFYCLFEEYDKWKPVILSMLYTIKTEEDIDERI